MALLKSYLRGSQDTVLTQVVSLLLEKIGSSAVVADESESASFRADLERLRDQVLEDSSPEKIVFTAGSATLVMEAYNKEINTLLRKERMELKSIVSILTEAIADIAGENTNSIEKVREISAQLERARAAGDLENLKTQLSEGLRSFRQEMLRQREETESEIIALRREIEQGHLRDEVRVTQEADAATHLPMKEACIQAMRASIPPGKRRYVVTLVVYRLQAVNARFGYEVGNRVLCRFGEFIQQQIRPEDRLFRWRGPALVALLERSEPVDEIRTQIRRMLAQPVEQTFDIEGRNVLIPVSAAWSAFQLVTTVAAAEKQIEMFTASQTTREYI